MTESGSTPEGHAIERYARDARDRLQAETDPGGYLPDTDLSPAIEVALILNQPLLVTGDPGTGKTQLAYYVADRYGLGKPHRFDTKSTSQARDLFYVFNAIGYFQAKDLPDASKDSRDYIDYHALGKAILHANQRSKIDHVVAKNFSHPGEPKRSLVLIDEIDKAPRDFPNDLLSEIENMRFRIPEIRNQEVSANDDMRPVVVITSNSERELPDPFLRRCVYHHVARPTSDRLRKIVASRTLGRVPEDSAFLSDALAITELLPAADGSGGTSPSELLAWLFVLRGLFPSSENPLRERTDGAEERIANSLGTLRKRRDDFASARLIVSEWLASRD